ncbi:MAG: alpha/beta hydrolase [Cyclobacteriaceae bacterium]|nr:alpha/beta hydrolase [Cyclobacteriaceae bacterium]
MAISCAVLPAYTPKIKTQNSVSSLEEIELGGVKQSILIRSEDKSNPILLFLHGGPGMPLMYLSHTFQRELEKEFIVIQWDRRGAGKSYNKRIDTLTITDEQYYKDAIQLIQLLQTRFEKQKIFLAGHSWGTYLGSLLAYKNPELFHAYVSIGQVVNSDKSRPLQEAFIRNKAKELNRNDALNDLDKFGVGAYEKWLFKFGAELHADTSYRPFIKAGMKSPEYSMFDAFKISKGSNFCSKHIQYKLVESTIEAEIQSYKIPCFFIVGKYDMTTPALLIEEYFNTVSAPDKKIIWFNQSAHFPFYEEKDNFFKTMVEIKNQVLTQNKK